MNKVIEYIIGAKDATGNAIKSALGRIRSFASGVMGQLANVKAGFDMAAGVVRKFAGIFGSAIKEAFKFEKAHSDFTGLLNSVDKAKEHISDLRQFASSTPLTFGDLSQASKLLLSFGMNVEDVMPSMKMLGDIAMGDAQKFQGLSLVFAQVKSAGKLMGQDLLQMINQGFNPLTVIAQQTGKSVAELKDMMAEGAISFDMVAEAMRVATSEGGLFNNAMANASKTGEGLMSTLQDKWTDVVRTFGEAFADTAKGGLQMLIEKLTQLVEDGTVDVWANNVASAMERVVEGAKVAMKAIEPLTYVWKAIKGGYESSAQAIGNLAGTVAGGGSISDAVKNTWSGFKQGWVDAFDLDGQEAENEANLRKDAVRKRAEANKSKSVSQEQKQQAKSLAEMMVDAESKAREKEQKKREKEAKKQAKAEERARIEAERAIAKEREKLQKKNAEQLRKDLSDAKSMLADAKANSEQAWGWYRDKNSWKAQISEERENRRAEARFQNELNTLSIMRPDWRTATNLSDSQEIVRRVALAREQENAAAEYEKVTAEATKRSADALEKMQTIFEGANAS